MIALGQAMRVVGKALSDNSPKILTSMAVAGVATTAILAGKAAFKTGQYVAEAKAKEEDLVEDMPTPREIARAVWKDYIPAVAVGTATIACIIGANSINTRRQAALMSAYSLTETAFREYKEKAFEELGKAREQKVYDDIAQKHVDGDPITNKEVILTGTGEHQCYDMLSGRYFLSDMQTIRSAENDINYQINNDGYAALNDFYRLIGLKPNEVGDTLGWGHEELMKLIFTTTLDANNKPCLAINYRNQPRADYYKIW